MATSQLTELITGDGNFNDLGFEDFIRGAAAPIPVIAIVGPQSSGKSTLMNHLFDTNFGVMNAQTGRSKTTNGIWIAKAPHIEPFTVVLDLEGTDGSEKGEDDTAFEKQSALFAIAIAQTVIINMWHSDVGREHAANRPLLTTVFEAMLSLFSPQKTTLHFVVRDGNNKTGTPSTVLKRDLKKDIEKIWEAVPKPPGNEGTLLSEIFNVEVTVLSNYEFMRDEFDEEVAQLQEQLISHTEHNNLDLSTSKISMRSAKNIWYIIKNNKGFEVPPFRLMFATTRCDEIAMEKLRLFQSNQAWLELQQKAKTQLAKDFGAQTNSILFTYLSEYDKETMNFESSTNGRYDQQVHEVRSSKRQDLTLKALRVVHPAYMNTLGHLRSTTLQSFTTQLKARKQNFILSAFKSFQTCYDSCLLQFDEQCSDYASIEQAKWEDDASSVREELVREIKEHALNQLRDEVSVSVTTKVLNVVNDRSVTDIWKNIRSFIETENEKARTAAVGIFGEENVKIDGIVADLEQHARDKVVTCFKDESLKVYELMKKRFSFAFVPKGATKKLTEEEALRQVSCYTRLTKEKAYRQITGNMEEEDDHMSTKEEAYRQCLDLLSTMAVIRLDDAYDVVQTELRNAISGDGISLSSLTWENVPPYLTLITPVRCEEIWTNFKQKMEDHLQSVEKYYEEQQKQLQQQQQQQSGTKPTWYIPKWVILGLCVLGIAGLTALLQCNPLLASPLALALAVAQGIVTFINGRYKYSATEEDIQMDDIPSKHPMLMESLYEYLSATYECMTSAHEILNFAAQLVV